MEFSTTLKAVPMRQEKIQLSAADGRRDKPAPPLRLIHVEQNK